MTFNSARLLICLAFPIPNFPPISYISSDSPSSLLISSPPLPFSLSLLSIQSLLLISLSLPLGLAHLASEPVHLIVQP
jgi:hypothetical protein